MRALRLPKGQGHNPGRTKGKFTQFRRLDALRELLDEHPAGLTLADLAQTLRVSERSVRRYLREMKEPLQLEFVEPVPGGARVWRQRPGEKGRSLTLRRLQAQALLASRKLFELSRGSAFFDEVEIAFSELRKLADRPIATPGMKVADVPDATLASRFVFQLPVARSLGARAEILDVAVEAICTSRAVDFEEIPSPKAESADALEPAARGRLYPYALVFQPDGEVFTLVGFHLEVKAMTLVSFDSLKSLALTREAFHVPGAFSLADYMHGDFGLALPSRARLLVEFEARAAEKVRRQKVHPAQRLAQAKDGRLRIAAPLGNREAVKRWVLSFGDAARVIEPKDLADELGAMFRNAAAKYPV